MKKVLLIAAVAGMSMVSCKKDYTCTCKYTPAGGTEQTYTYDLKDVKKSEAKDACDAAGSAWILAGGSCDFN